MKVLFSAKDLKKYLKDKDLYNKYVKCVDDNLKGLVDILDVNKMIQDVVEEKEDKNINKNTIISVKKELLNLINAKNIDKNIILNIVNKIDKLLLGDKI